MAKTSLTVSVDEETVERIKNDPTLSQTEIFELGWELKQEESKDTLQVLRDEKVELHKEKAELYEQKQTIENRLEEIDDRLTEIDEDIQELQNEEAI